MGKIQKYSESKADEEINKEEFSGALRLQNMKPQPSLIKPTPFSSDFVRRNPALLYPAFQLQMTLQKRTMGLGFWEQLARTRVELSEGNFISVTALLQVQISKAAFDSLIEIDDVSRSNTELRIYACAELGRSTSSS